MLVLRRQQGVEHCRSRDIIATISNLCVWYNLRQEKARDQERTVKSTCYRNGIFFYFVGVNVILWRTSKCQSYMYIKIRGINLLNKNSEKQDVREKRN